MIPVKNVLEKFDKELVHNNEYTQNIKHRIIINLFLISWQEYADLLLCSEEFQVY